MTRLEWGTLGNRFFMSGVDRGVLYVDSVGVPWNGLVSVTEGSSGAEAEAYYLDGVKYINMVMPKEYKAVIEALFSPEEFDQCDGTLAIGPGLLVTNQARKSFDFCYRTLIGNDIDGAEHAYRLHLVYNALATPTQNKHSTLNNNSNVSTLNWDITTTSRSIPDASPSAHLMVDTRNSYIAAVEVLENILYGDMANPPRMPSPNEVYDILLSYNPLRINDNGDGTFEALGVTKAVQTLSNGRYQIYASTIVMVDDGEFEVSSQYQ